MRATALLLTLLVIAPSAAARRRAVVPPSSPVLAAVLGPEAIATNYGTTPSLVQRCTDDQPCITDVLQPGQAKGYDINGQVLRIGPTDAGSVDVEGDGLTLPRTAFLMSTKFVPGAYDLHQFSQTILLISDHAGALGLKSVGPNGTTQEVVSIPYNRGITRVDPATTFLNIEPNFQFEITDTVGLAIEWRNNVTGTVTRIPALRIEESFTEAYLARITPTTIVMVKNALLQQQGGVNLWFLPEAGIDALQFGRGILIQPYGMISATNIPSFTGSSGDGSLKITGAPQGQDLLPFFAWAITDGIPDPLTRFQQAATAHGSAPGNPAPYQNAMWTGLRTDATHHTELDLQSIDSLPNTGILTLTDQGIPFLTQVVLFSGYSSQHINLDALAGTHTLYNATLQLNDDPSTQFPFDTPRATGIALVTSTSGTNVRAPLTVPRPTLTAQYAVTAEIYVFDHGQTFEQTTHPSSAIMLQLLNLASLTAYADGRPREFTCPLVPDPIVNSLPELLLNYAKLTPVEQQEFSGDREGFAPFAANVCDTSKTQYAYLVRLTISSFVTAQEYVDHFLLPLQNTRVFLNNSETRCMITGACGVRSYSPDLAAIIQPNYVSSWSTPDALAEQLRAWADGSDANGELFDGKDPLSYNNTGSPTNIGFLLKPAGGGVPFNLSAAQMSSAFAALRSFLIAYVSMHAAAYGGNASGYSLSIDPTWATQDPN